MGIIQLILILSAIVLILFIYYIFLGKYWIQALLSGINVSHKEILLMYFRKIPVRKVINMSIKLRKAGLEVDLDKIQTHYLAGGNLDDLVR